MAQIRYRGDEPRQVSILPAGATRKVDLDEVFTVPDDHAESYDCQPHYFEWVDKPEGHVSRDELVAQLRDAGLPVDGSKDDLAQRLADHQAREAAKQAQVAADTAREGGGGYDALTKPQLVELAGSRGLDTSGTKADLLERLAAADNDQNSDASDTGDAGEGGH